MFTVRVVLLILFLVDGIYCLKKADTSRFAEIPINQNESILCIFTILIVATILRHVLKIWRLPIPHSAFMLTLGVLWGACASHSESILWYSTIILADAKLLFLIFMAPLVFKMIFCVDVHIFLRAGMQIIIISLPVALLTASIVGALEMLIMDPITGTYEMAFHFGLLCVPIYPLEVVQLLREIGTHTKIIGVILEGESVGTIAATLTLGDIIMGIYDNTITTWYHFVMVGMRKICGGIAFGLLFGYLSSLLVRIMYTDPNNVLIVTVMVPYIAAYICLEFLDVSSVLCVVIVGIFLSIERTSFSTEMDEFLFNFWETLGFMLNTLIFLIAGANFSIHIIPRVGYEDIALVLVTYILVSLCRFLGFFCFACVLSRVGYGLTFRNMLIAVWGGLKNPLNLLLTMSLIDNYEETDYGTVFMLHVTTLHLFTILINAPLMPWILKLMGLSQISMAKKVNMNNCLNHLAYRRERSIAVMKMDRFLSDANWPMVNSATTLKHPYKLYQQETDDINEEDFFMGFRFAMCPDCKKDVLNEPTPKELKDMTKESKLRVLKAKKISYTRQYENGLLSKAGIRVLIQSTDYAMDREDPTVDLDGLFKLFKKEGLTYKIKRQILSVFGGNEAALKPPKRYWRRVCYKIVTHIGFTVFIYVIIALNVSLTITELIISPPSYSTWSYSLKTANAIFFIIYLLEFIFKIYGYSWIYVWKHGVKTYFRSHWNKFDFLVLIINVVDLILDCMDILLVQFSKSDSLASTVTLPSKLLRIIRFFKLFRLCKACYPNMLRWLNAKIDSSMTFAYDVGKAFVNGEEDVLERLPQLIDHEGIREQLRLKMEADRLKITKELGLIQKERPWIAVTVKTKQAITTALNAMKSGVGELKTSGWIDDVEYKKLMQSLNERYKYVRTVKAVDPSPPKEIFEELPWMAGDDDVTEYLYANVATRKFDPGDVICAEGEVTEGIYIVITGILLMTYSPNSDILSKLKEYGTLPVTDYTTNVRYNETVSEYILSGNSIGELSTLTGRPYDCKVTSDSYTQVLVIRRDVIHKAMELNYDPVNGLECRLWRSISIRIGMLILKNAPTYQGVNQDEINYALERAFVPNLSNYKIFVVNEMMEDIILIEGVVVDFNTRELYTAPLYIPRTVQRLVLPRSSAISVSTKIETKILIIPVKEFDEYEIMLKGEEISELVSTVSSKCLQHIFQNQSSKYKKHKRKGGILSLTGRKPNSRTMTDATSRSTAQSKSKTTYNSETEPEEEMRNINMSVISTKNSVQSKK